MHDTQLMGMFQRQRRLPAEISDPFKIPTIR